MLADFRYGAIFYSHRRQEDYWAPSNFLELATPLFHGIAEAEAYCIASKMITRVVKTIGAASPSFAGAFGKP
ncbi:hypothetical protein HJB56_28310 [Rhizobium lentis]|uniref:hypothetical protein n=1 Tax=Rhizobium lentis TaxID=1138194 RepID=UPI001A93A7BC|nr:hypothetical protein [Rhizobium lentis]MBX4959210.1 hypothetical protein [Rhizobium lentis]MBX4977229.1 hypothetical protein [Rhizobium lentis]MBX4989216.1 hypothetical protein [Rhizobium lentis]MBX5001116.1 hypothetical protein [Rhizobium lentis]MBX5007690.1 hypothetical protein [Rhizobium lentis]